MSRPETAASTYDAPHTSTAAAPPPAKTFTRDCAVLLSTDGPVIASGFSLEVPLGDKQSANEDAGFGVRYAYDCQKRKIAQKDIHSIRGEFPLGHHRISVKEATPELVARFSECKNKHLSLVSVCIDLPGKVHINGFGLPFENRQRPEFERIVNKNAAIVEDITLLDVLSASQFFFVVPSPSGELEKQFNETSLPPPFSYPYGTEHSWDEERYKQLLRENKGKTQFEPAYSYQNDSAHLAVLTQANVQDTFWLDDAAKEIFAVKWPAYFVPRDLDAGENSGQFYVVIPTTAQFRKKYEAPWRRFTRSESFSLALFESPDNDEPSAEWECRIMSHPDGISQLKNHPTTKDELVLLVRRPRDQNAGPRFPVAIFQDRSEANRELEKGNWSSAALKFDAQLNEVKRKVDAVCLFHPDAKPSNPDFFFLRVDNPEEKAIVEAKLADNMVLHRALLRGNGFYVTSQNSASVDIADAMAAISSEDRSKHQMRPLPKTDLVSSLDEKFADALFEEALPEDRAPFRNYLMNRILGLGLLTAAAGFGKTTALSIATLAMQSKFLSVLCGGPSNAAVDNFARRLDRITTSVVKRHNVGMSEGDPNRKRHAFVLRVYKKNHELAAVRKLLEEPELEDDAAPNSSWGADSKWKLPLSLAFWVLVLLRSNAKGVRQLHVDDKKGLHELQKTVDNQPDLANLRAVATGKMPWDAFEEKDQIKELLEPVMNNLVACADLLCTTPAMTENDKECHDWKNVMAGAVAVDEAANMNRADLYCIWGNTLLPCFLAGDSKQLPPTVMTGEEKDKDENFIHRLANDGKISPLEFFQASGFPVYRLRSQLRMANGLFDDVAASVYPEVPFSYAEICNVNLPQFEAGRRLEAYMQSKYPEVVPPPPNKLRPIFVHCEGSRVYQDEITGSKRSPDQVSVAMDLALDLVKTQSVKATQLVVLAPYSANVDLIGKFRKRSKYLELSAMSPASSIDGYQGKEADVVIVVMGTSYPKPGPGFTSDENRLNVLLTRQRCGLVIVGDINCAGPVDTKDKGKGKGKGKGKAGDKFLVVDAQGNTYWTKAKMLKELCTKLNESGRVARVEIERAKEKAKVVEEVEAKPGSSS